MSSDTQLWVILTSDSKSDNPTVEVSCPHYISHEINDAHCRVVTVQGEKATNSARFSNLELFWVTPNLLIDVGSILNYLRIKVNNSEACRTFVMKYEKWRIGLIVKEKPSILNSYR